MAAALDIDDCSTMSMPRYIELTVHDPAAVSAFIRHRFANNPASISETDPGFDNLTPIYAAIFSRDMIAIQVLIELATPAIVLGNDVLGLFDYDNGTALTPSEVAHHLIKLDIATMKPPAMKQIGQRICDLVDDVTHLYEKS